MYMTVVYDLVASASDPTGALDGFEWDAGNSEKHWKRHQVTQAECEQVFANLPLLIAGARNPQSGEPRFFALGRTDLSRELTVVFTTRGNKVRVISARPMSRRERKEYARARNAAEAEEADS